MSDYIIRLPEPEVLRERLTKEYWRSKYRKGNSFIGPDKSIEMLEEFFSESDKDTD